MEMFSGSDIPSFRSKKSLINIKTETKTKQAKHVQDGILATSVFTLISFQALHCTWSFT